MSKIKISFFRTENQGDELQHKIQTIVLPYLSELGLECEKFSIVCNGTNIDFLNALSHDDIVIFDGSIEKDENGNWDSNYAAATLNSNISPNIKVVSRTQLPINFVPRCTNVPLLGDEKTIVVDGDVQRVKTYTNDDIIEWLKKDLLKMFQDGLLPFPSQYKLDENLNFSLSMNGRQALELVEKNRNIQSQLLDDLSLPRRGGAFISYLSYYDKNAINEKTVHSLIEHIKNKHKNDNYPVTWYSEGAIVSEFLTEQRRWEIVSFVERRIREIDEFYIFLTEPNPEGAPAYFDSWWTQGEIIALMYMKFSGAPLPKIFVYDPQNDRIDEKEDSFIPDLDEETAKEIARYFSNSDALSRGDENTAAMRRLRLYPKPLLKIHAKAMASVADLFLPEPMAKTLKDTTYESIHQSAHSHVYDKSFTRTHIAVCPRCCQRRPAMTIDDFANSDTIWSFILTNTFNKRLDKQTKRALQQRGFHSIMKRKFKWPWQRQKIDMQEIEQRGYWQCPTCGLKKQVKKNKNNAYFFYWPIRYGNRRTGPDGRIIEEIVPWEFVNQSSKK